MSDEINLILTKLKLVSESEESCAYICDKEHSKILYDYIINLQDTLKDREEYIGHLEELCDKYEEEHNNEFQCWKKDRKELLDKRARINKAIKICEPLVEWGECTINGKILKQIYEILKGGDKE